MANLFGGALRGRRAPALAVTLALLMLAGCHKKPEGQVIATVDGSEITRRDLLTELSALGGKSEADLKAVQPSLVETLVDRKLLVQEAQREKLDKNPQFLAAEQRQHDLLLAQMLAQSGAAHVKAPDAAAINAYIADNPLQFGGRKILEVDEIRTSTAGLAPHALEPLHDLKAVADYLTAHKIKFDRNHTNLDTMSLPKQVAQQLASQPGGEPVAIGAPNSSTIVVVSTLATHDAPVPAGSQTAVATALLKRQGGQKAVEDQISALRSSADIKYLPGFEPPSKTTTSAAK